MSLVLGAFAGSWDTAGMTMSSQQLFPETDSRPITSIVRQRQLRLYGHVARYPEADPACRVVSVKHFKTPYFSLGLYIILLSIHYWPAYV